MKNEVGYFKRKRAKVIETDVLVIGGGIGGPFAAMYASERGAKVILLEKAAVKRSGSCWIGIGGWHQVLTPEIRLDDIAKSIVDGTSKYMGTMGLAPMNKGLVDENLIYIAYKDNWETIHALEKWGQSMKYRNNEYIFTGGDNLTFAGQYLKLHIARALQNSSVTVLEKTMGLDLLTKDGTIAGATALNIWNGQFIEIRAKAIVLATGTVSRIFNPFHYASPGMFKMLYHYHAGSGDGVAMALKAGAEVINMEVPGIGAGLTGTRLADKMPLSHAPGLAGSIHDAKGVKLVDEKGGHASYFRVDVPDLYKIEREGRGPCFSDVTHMPEEFHRWLKEHTEDSFLIHLQFAKERGLDTRRNRFEIGHYKPEHNSVISGVAYDENGMTSINRLYAVGDMCGGNSFLGAAHAAVFGMRAGKHVAANLSEMKQIDIDEKQVAKQKKAVFAPMKMVERGVEPLEVEVKIRDIVERYCGTERSEGMINQGLWRLRSVRDRFQAELMARDCHELMTAQEVRNLFLLAEVYMLSARERKESGMRIFRLDYPDKANDPWKEAIATRMEDSEIKFTHRKMPELRENFRSK